MFKYKYRRNSRLNDKYVVVKVLYKTKLASGAF